MQSFFLCFIPLFVAIDPLGILPVFLSITAHLTPQRRRKLALEALPTALIIGVCFFLFGSYILRFLGIRLADLQIAGGAILFVLALLDLLVPGKPSVQEEQSLGIVPLATPLIVGPAVLTVGLVLVNEHGEVAALSALVANLLITALVFLGANRILHLFPLNAMRAISKVVDLLMAAIGVAFVREGVIATLAAATTPLPTP